MATTAGKSPQSVRRYKDTPHNRAKKRVGLPIVRRRPAERVIASHHFQEGQLLRRYSPYQPNQLYQITHASPVSRVVTLRRLAEHHHSTGDYFGSGQVWAHAGQFPEGDVEKKVHVCSDGRIKGYGPYRSGEKLEWWGYAD